MTFGRDLCHVGTTKLICKANQWTGCCVMRFFPEGCSEQSMILHLCGSGEYTLVLCFSIRGDDGRVSAPFRTCSVEGLLERSLICWFITVLECVFTLVQVRLSDVKKIP